MTTPTDALLALAPLLQYPGDDAAAAARRALGTLAAALPEAAAALEPFVVHVERASPDALEEAFTRTFDWSEDRSLDLGWHLYGDRYDRGAFLVQARAMRRAAGIDDDGELPDHLPSLLRVLPHLPGTHAAEFARDFLVPALARLRKGFEDGDNPWAAVVDAVRAAVAALAATAPATAPALAAPTGDAR